MNIKTTTRVKTSEEQKQAIRALILSQVDNSQIAQTLGIAQKTVTAIANKYTAELEDSNIELSNPAHMPTRKALAFSLSHDIVRGILLGELFKTKREIEQATNKPPIETEEPGQGIRTQRAAKPKGQSMAIAGLYSRLALLSDQIRKNDKAFFDAAGSMGVAAPGAPLQMKGPPHSPTNNNFENMSELQCLEELKSSASRQSSYADRRIRELSNRVELDVDCEVLDD